MGKIMSKSERNNWIKLLSSYLTPCYFYDAGVIKNKLMQLKSCFGDKVKIFYSLKANPNVSIAAWLRINGAHAEVCSLIELEIALQAGYTPKQIIFLGPAKSDDTIKRCIELNIYAIIVESDNEIIKINNIAQEVSSVVKIGVRINPNFAVDDAPLKMGGKASQFGIDQDKIPNTLSLIRNCVNIDLIGIHIYNGTRVLNADSIGKNIIKIIQYVRELILGYTLTLDFVDVGGGFGVPYYANEYNLNMNKLNEIIEPFLEQFGKDTGINVIIESGRFLVAEAGTFITKIIDIKESKDEVFLVADGGTNCHMAAVGIGSFVKRNFPISLLNINDNSIIDDSTDCYQIVGPLCTPGDLLARNIYLVAAQIGDYILIKNSGAYGPSASPVYFLSHGHPNEVLIHNNESFLIRQADSYLDISRNQYLVKLS